MINLLVTLLFLIIILGVIYWILTIIPLPAPFMKIAQIVMAVIVLLFLIGIFTGSVPTVRFPN